MTRLLTTNIRVDGNIQPRQQLDNERVQHYANCMEDGDKFPPVTVFHDGSSYWLSSGFHRFHAQRKLGFIEVEAEVQVGTQEDAQLHAILANSKHGLPFSREDVHTNLKRMFEHPISKNWPDAKIAKHIGVSAMTVGRARKAHKAPETEQKVRTVERSGKSYEVNVAKIGRKPVQEEPEINTEVAELSETVTALHEENQRLKDAIALGQWDATDIEKVDAEQTIQELRDRITMLEADNRALRDSRDMYQSRNAELMATVKSLQSKLKKLEK